jgi:membrane protein implicated in regulation of membrane protease activity
VDTIYLVCALVGGTLLVWQVLMSLVGLGGDHGMEVDHDIGFEHELGHELGHDVSHEHDHGHVHGSSLFVSLLTFRTVAAALTFFGLTGLAATAYRPEEPGLSLGLAVTAGLGALLLVATLMKMLHRLKADGTARITRAVGQRGTVYLTIPARKQGAGKVTVKLQNRTMEYHAVTPEEELPTGARIVVVSVVGPGTLEVVPAPTPERTTHV